MKLSKRRTPILNQKNKTEFNNTFSVFQKWRPKMETKGE